MSDIPITAHVCGGKQLHYCPFYEDHEHQWTEQAEVAPNTFSSVCKCGQDAFSISLWECP
jgi:hypothetical protein